MSEQIIGVIDELGKRFGVAIDWTQEGVLPYVEELCSKYVRYEIATSSALCIIWLALTTISAVILYKAVKAEHGCGHDDFLDIIHVISGIAAGVLIFILIVLIPMEIKDIITCLTFPEKMILDYLQSFLS